MKKTTLALFSTCFMLSATAATNIEYEKYRWLAKYDSNQDYTVDLEEAYNARTALFKIVDKNKDNVINTNEYQQYFEENLQKKIDHDRKQSVKQSHVRFNAMDKDDNKLMSHDEYMATAKRSFDFYDTNEDGVITSEDKKPTFTSSKKSTLTEAEKVEKAEKKRKNKMSSATRIVRMPTTHSKSGMLTMYDQNNDKKITWEEYQQKRNIDFTRADEDGNNELTSDEYITEFEDRLDAQIAKTKTKELAKSSTFFSSIDKNNDQQISIAEFQLKTLINFDRYDTNNDGKVTFEEAVTK